MDNTENVESKWLTCEDCHCTGKEHKVEMRLNPTDEMLHESERDIVLCQQCYETRTLEL